MASENTRKWAIIPEPNSMTVGEGTVLLPYAGRVNESIAIGDGDFLLAHQLVADIRSATGTDWDCDGRYVVGLHQIAYCGFAGFRFAGWRYRRRIHADYQH